MKPIDILLLSQADILKLDLGLDDVLGVVEEAMRGHSDGTYEMDPKIGMAICDIALGHLTLGRAREKGLGQTFRLS